MADRLLSCHLRHEPYAWRLKGSRRWVCGLCHPPADDLVIETRTGCTLERASVGAAKVAGGLLDRG